MIFESDQHDEIVVQQAPGPGMPRAVAEKFREREAARRKRA
jgi:hypothetical protein